MADHTDEVVLLEPVHHQGSQDGLTLKSSAALSDGRLFTTSTSWPDAEKAVAGKEQAIRSHEARVTEVLSELNAGKAVERQLKTKRVVLGQLVYGHVAAEAGTPRVRVSARTKDGRALLSVMARVGSREYGVGIRPGR